MKAMNGDRSGNIATSTNSILIRMLCQLAYTVYAYRPWKFVVPNNIESINARVGYAAEGILAQLNVIISFLSLADFLFSRSFAVVVKTLKPVRWQQNLVQVVTALPTITERNSLR